jgi:hypothetical protein
VCCWRIVLGGPCCSQASDTSRRAAPPFAIVWISIFKAHAIVALEGRLCCRNCLQRFAPSHLLAVHVSTLPHRHTRCWLTQIDSQNRKRGLRWLRSSVIVPACTICSGLLAHRSYANFRAGHHHRLQGMATPFPTSIVLPQAFCHREASVRRSSRQVVLFPTTSIIHQHPAICLQLSLLCVIP